MRPYRWMLLQPVPSLVLVATVAAALAHLAAVSAQTPAPPEWETIDADLPSASTGLADGALALSLFVPKTATGARYPDGAPVIVQVPGGTGEGSLRPFLPQLPDMVRIAFLLPGGVDETSGRQSDGEPDYRGAASMAALRDVILFAAGRLPDAEGRSIDQLTAVPIRHRNIGLIGLSNGGNLATAVAARHGRQLAGWLRYVVQWESPVSSQIATADLGGVRLDCPGQADGYLRLAVSNPRYLGYGRFELPVDFGDLAYDATEPTVKVFHDGNGDGVYTTVLDPGTGCRTPDLDGDGRLAADEDWPLFPFRDAVVAYYSRPVTRALADSGAFGSAWPRGIASPEAADAWWEDRESVRHYDAARRAIPDLEGMVVTSVLDHVQALSDHPHVRQAFEGWAAVGAWVRINPAATYLTQVDPALAGRLDLPNNRPNTPPDDWLAATSYCLPEDVADETGQAAAVWQMADRAEIRDGSPTAAPPTPTATATAPPTSGIAYLPSLRR